MTAAVMAMRALSIAPGTWLGDQLVAECQSPPAVLVHTMSSGRKRKCARTVVLLAMVTRRGLLVDWISPVQPWKRLVPRGMAVRVTA